MIKWNKILSILLVAVMALSLLPTPPVRAAVDVASVSVPSYSGGTSSSWMTYDGGLGTALGDTGSSSKMRIVTGTTSSQYSTYRDLLKSKGYTVLYSKSVPAKTDGTNNRHYKFLSPDGTYVIYTYWTPATSQVRIIVDTHVDTLRKFTYTSPDRLAAEKGGTEVYMYSLTASTDGFKNTSTYATENRSNSGSMFIVKMPDNSLFVVDGGTYYQMGDRACEQLYDFMRSITGVPEGEKIIINTWFVSHLHFDHCAGFPRFLHKYNTEFELLNIMYNFDIEGASQKYIRRVARLFPNAKYYKQHTGEIFDICGVRFDVLYTVEDRYKPNSSNKLILNDSACLGNYTEENNGSTVLRMTFDGKEMLLTGDIEKADAVLMAMYPAADLKSDLLQIPHHAFDEHTTLVKTIAPTISFINQAESAVRNREDLYDHNAAWKSYAGTIYFAGEKTIGYSADKGVFYNKVFDTVDFINWSARTYEMEEENAYVSDPVVDPEAYYRYTRVKTLTSAENTYIIVDDKLDQTLSYDAVTGTAGSAVPGFHADNDEFYFADSQRRGVNWLISYTTSGSLDVQATSGTTYSGTVPIYKGTGDYWGTPTKGRYLAVANGDTYASTGQFESWTAFTNMMETATKPILIDLLSGGYFLIYRYGYTSTKYYPVYRDGNNSTGWGSGKLDKSVVTGNLAYFRHRMYAYNETPDTMLLSWKGHKDYYVNKGTPQADVIGLLSADLRVTYRFENFAGTGEIFYDGWEGQKAGTYWLEFPNGYKSGTPGTYAVEIKYKNASGTVLELGGFNLHVKNPADDPDSKALFFDFNDDADARLRYKNQPQYNEVNFDSGSRWTYIEYHGTNKISDPTTGYVDPKAGILKIYSKTNDTVRRNLSMYTYSEGKTPLNYNAKDAEVIQIRFKMDNLKAWSDQAPYFRMFYYYNNGTENVYTHDRDGKLGADFVSDGKYMTMTIPILTAGELSSVTDTYAPTQTLNSCTSITGLRPCFLNLVPIDASQPSSITYDYIYIGPKEGAPAEEEDNFLFFDFTDTEEDRTRYDHERYNYTNFDREENPFWATSETNSEVQVYNEREMNNKEGVLKVAVAETTAAGTNNSNLGPWVATTQIPGVFVERANKTFHGLGYEPQAGDYVQVRFKLTEGVVRAGENIATDIVLIYDRTTDGTVARGTYDIVPTYEFKTGEYLTVNFELTEEFTSADVISTIGFRFRGIKSETKGAGHLIIDYIYVGQKGTVPPTAQTVTFCTEDGSVLDEVRVSAGGTAVYTGEMPTKAYDKVNHYTFAKWVDKNGAPAVLDNIAGDLTVYASFTATKHSYKEKLITPATCTGEGQKEYTCSCGYGYVEAVPVAAHTPAITPAVAPTCTETGKTSGTYCSVCNAVIVAQSEVAALGHSPEIIPGTPATCTATGLSDGSYCTVCKVTLQEQTVLPVEEHSAVVVPGKAPTCISSGLSDGSKCGGCGLTLKAQETLPRLGHDMHYTDLGDDHEVKCSRCDKISTEAHSYENGLCICGKEEPKEPVEDSALKIGHSLDLASDITLNYAVTVASMAGFDMDSVRLEITVPVYEGNALAGNKVVVLEPELRGSYYYFTLKGRTAVHMNDRMIAVLYGTKDGQTYRSPTDSYSIADYAYAQLGKTSAKAELRALCAELLRYGAQAQIFKSYRTDALVDSRMTETQKALLTAEDTVTFQNNNVQGNELESPQVTWLGKSLDLNTRVTIVYIVDTANYSGDAEDLTMHLEYVDSKGVMRNIIVTDPQPYSEVEGRMAFRFDGLLAAELRTVVKAQIYAGETAVSNSLVYSADTYGNGRKGQLLSLCKALFAYSDKAKAYFTGLNG